MKITKSHFKKIVEEELGAVLKEGVRELETAVKTYIEDDVREKVAMAILMKKILVRLGQVERAGAQASKFLPQSGAEALDSMEDMVERPQADEFKEKIGELIQKINLPVGAGLEENKMKITKTQLKQIIKEELSEVINEAGVPFLSTGLGHSTMVDLVFKDSRGFYDGPFSVEDAQHIIDTQDASGELKMQPASSRAADLSDIEAAYDDSASPEDIIALISKNKNNF
jgi:hypothetical protein